MLYDQKKVVWSEGMTLDPHHFQQWDRHQQGLLNARVRSLTRFDWGLAELTLDRERLANGEVALVRCSGVMPDGLVFDFPDREELPAPRSVGSHFTATAERLSVYLAVPAERPGGSNCLLQGADNRREVRYRAATISVNDGNTGADEQPIEVARANIQLRFGEEPLAEYTTLPVAEVVRNPDGAYGLDEHFIPPCLRLAASTRLTALVQTILERLVARSTALAERGQSAAKQRELSPSDVRALSLLQIVNSYIPLLKHYQAHGGTHPERLYLTLGTLAGQLSACRPEAGVHPRAFPVYDHAQLARCYGPLDEVLRRLLGEAALQTNYVELPLQRQRENLYTAAAPQHVLQGHQLFLVARSDDMPEEQMVRELPQMLRVAAPDSIDAVLRSLTRALPIEHTHRLPVGMPVEDRASYFQFQKRGPFWEAICEREAVAVFVPSEIEPRLTLKLVATK